MFCGEARVKHYLLPGALAAALFSCGNLGGCSVGPDFQSPAFDAPKSWPQTAAGHGDGRPTPQQIEPDWWLIYRDPVLNKLENMVAEANLDIKAAAHRLAQSRAARQVAASSQFPSINSNASYARERASPNGVLGLLGTLEQETPGQIANGTQGFGPARLPGLAGQPFNLFQYGIDASWEVDLWGHVRRQVEGADADTAAMADHVRDVLVTIFAETAHDYIQLRSIQAQIVLTKQNIDIARHGLELTRMRFTNGATTTLDVANASAQLATIEAYLPALEREEGHLINALSFLVDEEPRALSPMLGARRQIPMAPPKIPMGVPAELAERRPDIRMATERLHAAVANIGVAVAEFYPRITLSGSLDIQALTFSGLGTWASRQYGLGPTVSIPIFQGGRLRGQLELRNEQQKEAAILYRRTVLNAWHEIDNALIDYHVAQARRASLAEATKQNEIALTASQTQYTQGSSDFLNVLTAQNRLLSTKSQLLQASADTAIAVAQLYKALGGGWEKRLGTTHPVTEQATEKAESMVKASLQ
ncbi:RND efflux system, outer membrane lipoprotein, NodT family [Beijerinckia indica subsp. indica ATCC 9039]|uniref:RND efflux system, outer membrane lipoprotein, NodT family n=2 Tax=Beijerinckia TaxID=532 RepID=B2IIF6_BEII9|nr:RND efflux system, outer membrane lipoprotein, NodT family [Beijerinckia indica subsp. indica ATCC 9039]